LSKTDKFSIRMTPRPSRGHLGVKLARPDAQVISILRDGSYIFSNPVAVHYASTMHKLPVLTIVINNAMWGAVRRATLGMYPDGEAAKSNKPPFIDLDDLPAFETICEASGGYGERVEGPAGCCHTNLIPAARCLEGPLRLRPRWRLATSGTLRL
jgi:hypothetical protein